MHPRGLILGGLKIADRQKYTESKASYSIIKNRYKRPLRGWNVDVYNDYIALICSFTAICDT